MTEVSIDLKARDQMSSVLDHVTQRLGIFNSAGLAMGITFAGINIAMNMLTQASSSLIDYFRRGAEMNRQFEVSLTRLKMTISTFDLSMGILRNDVISLGEVFGTDFNEMTAALTRFIQEGYSASDSMRALYETNLLVIGSNTDLSTSQEAIIKGMEIFGYGTDAAGYLAEKFNAIMNLTGMKLSEITNLLTRTTTAIDASGASFDDIVKILYTLHGQGYAARSMIAELNKVLSDTNWRNNFKMDILPTGTESLTQKYQKMGQTIQFTVDQVKELNKERQMRLGGATDISAVFDKDTSAMARQVATAKELGQQEPAMWTALKAASSLGPIGTLITGQFISNVEELSTAYEEADAQAADAAKANAAFARSLPLRELMSITSQLAQLKKSLADLRTQQDQVNQDMGDLTSQKNYTIAMRTATLAVQTQEDAIAQLQHASDALNLSQMQNSLEIMKIQYGEDTRHGPTREEKDRIKELEHQNLGLQIKEQENQIAIVQIRIGGLYNAQQTLDAIQQQHDAVMYNNEIRDLTINIKAKKALYDSLQTDIDATNAAITKQQELWRSNELIKHIAWAVQYHNWSMYAYNVSQSEPTGTDTGGSTGGGIPRWKWGYQHGGPVKETGLAMVHEGEFVIPKGGAVSSSGGGSVSSNVTISIVAELHKDVDVEDWGRKLGAGLQSGFLSASSSGTTTVTSRKTGSSIIVPGSQVTTTTGLRTNRAGVGVTSLTVPQPIANKSRFRMG